MLADVVNDAASCGGVVIIPAFAVDRTEVVLHHLNELVELADRIAAAHHSLVEGEHGLGRARYGLAITGRAAADWAARFPANPFQVPAVVDASGDAPQLAKGLVEGQKISNILGVLTLPAATLRDFDQPGSQPFEAGILNPPEACAPCQYMMDAVERADLQTGLDGCLGSLPGSAEWVWV